MKTFVTLIIMVIVAIVIFNVAVDLIGGLLGWVIALGAPLIIGLGIGVILDKPKWLK